ncbi:hypothetical protein JMA_31730 [Jeotgalibacillus malaysiensis]|uniref:Uncharacterized protein n=1 Tax=Jeotgalibacillus malaysiensis TaxID=1508404 RepID=A0A0B5AQF5_9BACL|nr:hypothetical protein [Jeotgalibacillus malaysiensis]AJD92490.1 hypothetical protein JMA_31730 [Jeotgalibacillus malaysiensis]
MFAVWFLGILTVVSVFLALKLKKKRLLLTPVLGVGALIVIEIVKVPMPFWDTVTFIFDLRS